MLVAARHAGGSPPRSSDAGTVLVAVFAWLSTAAALSRVARALTVRRRRSTVASGAAVGGCHASSPYLAGLRLLERFVVAVVRRHPGRHRDRTGRRRRDHGRSARGRGRRARSPGRVRPVSPSGSAAQQRIDAIADRWSRARSSEAASSTPVDSVDRNRSTRCSEGRRRSAGRCGPRRSDHCRSCRCRCSRPSIRSAGLGGRTASISRRSVRVPALAAWRTDLSLEAGTGAHLAAGLMTDGNLTEVIDFFVFMELRSRESLLGSGGLVVEPEDHPSSLISCTGRSIRRRFSSSWTALEAASTWNAASAWTW